MNFSEGRQGGCGRTPRAFPKSATATRLDKIADFVKITWKQLRPNLIFLTKKLWKFKNPNLDFFLQILRFLEKPTFASPGRKPAGLLNEVTSPSAYPPGGFEERCGFESTNKPVRTYAAPHRSGICCQLPAEVIAIRAPCACAAWCQRCIVSVIRALANRRDGHKPPCD